MPYVDAMRIPPDPLVPEATHLPVVAIDENGVMWWLTEGSQVGDWLRYVEGGGEVREYDETTFETWQHQATARPAEGPDDEPDLL